MDLESEKVFLYVIPKICQFLKR